MMLHTVIKREINRTRGVVPFCLRLVDETSPHSSSFLAPVFDHGSQYSTQAGLQSESKSIKEKVEPKLEDNPFYSKYAEKIAKAAPKLKEIEKAAVQEEKLKMPSTSKLTAKSSEMALNESKAFGPPKFASKNLDKIVKIDLLKEHTPEEIGDIWTSYHKTKPLCICAVIPGDIYDKIYETGKQYPLFVFPMPREKKSGDDQEEERSSSIVDTGVTTEQPCYEFILAQFSEHQIYFTPLIMYQRHLENAPPALVIHHYPELRKEKNIVLMSGEYDDKLFNLLEAQCLANQVQLYYGGSGGGGSDSNNTNRKILLHKFNREPDNFNYEDLIYEFENSLILK